MNVIEFNDICEKYRIKFIRKGRVSWEEVWALKDINFKVEDGEVLGIIGENGAGKTTLLKLIAGMLIPDRGKINVTGKVSVLMELGAGFNPEFTGRENILLNAKMYGLDESELEQKIDRIIEFAGLDKFIDAPIKYYSQGMYMRLAFALAVFVEPDILLIDDILAVGDEEAQRKCIKKVFALKEQGKSIVLVSHNMNMVNKLCNRVILLEKGKIVQKGLPGDVIPYYLETIGDKRRIATLEKGKLRATFNNGRIILAYGGFSLTKGMGGYVVFFAPATNSWISSLNLSWQIKSFVSDRIVAEGKSDDGVVYQTWMLQLRDEELQWYVEMKEKAIKEPHVDLVVVPQYNKWTTLNKNGSFPCFIFKTNWQDLGLYKCPGGLVGIGPDSGVGYLPNLVVERQDENTQINLFNTGYEQEGRIVQWHLDLNNNNFISIKIFPERGIFEDYIQNTKQQFLLKQKAKVARLLFVLHEVLWTKQKVEEAKQKAEEARLSEQGTISLGDLRLFVDVKEKLLRLFFKEEEITKEDGIHSAFNVAKKWFVLRDGDWKTQKVSEKELILIVDYQSLSLSQQWTLVCRDENVLEIKVEIEVKGPISFANRDLGVALQDKYKEWKSNYGHGELLATPQYINEINPIRLKNNKISKILLKPEDKHSFPQLFFNITSHTDKRIIGIYKRKRKSGICLNVCSSLIITKKEKITEPGRYIYFQGKIILGEAIALENELIPKSLIELKKSGIQLVFEQGRGKIFWRGEEITTGLGVYTSVRASGIWYDSYQAIWDVDRSERNKIAVIGHWPYIPISQIWQIELVGKDLFLWKVDMEIYEETYLEIEQANLMLHSKYKTWEIHGPAKGEFTDEYTNEYDILPYRFWYGKTKEIGAKGTSLPRILFQTNIKNGAQRAVVENTDDFYRGRLLQYQKTNSQKLLSGKYPYFKGAIKIDSGK